MANVLRPRDKPWGGPIIWRPNSVPIPDHDYLMLPCEMWANTIRDWKGGYWGPFTNSPIWSGSRFDTRLTFLNSGSRYIITGHPPISTALAPFTVAILMQHTVTTASYMAYAEGNTGDAVPLMGISNSAAVDGRIRFFYRNNANASNISGDPCVTVSAMNDGNWHWYHAVSYGSGTNGYLYADGVLNDQGTIGTGATTLNTTSIGAVKRTTIGLYWSGSIAQVVLWRQPLNAAQVASHILDPYMWLRGTRENFYSIPSIVRAHYIRSGSLGSLNSSGGLSNLT
jgi:hypothetical protein